MFDELIAPQTISVGLRRELLAVMDTRSEDLLRALIESAIDRIAWPKLDIDDSSLPVPIAGFSGRELRSEHEMAALRTQLEEIAHLQSLITPIEDNLLAVE